MSELFEPTDNFNSGYIKIFRSVSEHYLFNEKHSFSKFEAWVDILLKANHKPRQLNIKNVKFIVERGQCLRSLDTWATDWRWDKSKVRRFLELLQKENMIELKNELKSTRLTICNYDTYQCFGNANETQMKRKRNADETLMTPNKEAKKIINFKIDIKERKSSFKNEIRNFENDFDKNMLNDFYTYWCESNEQNKMRFELEKTWELNLRLERWKRNQKSNQVNGEVKISKAEAAINSNNNFMIKRGHGK